MRILYFILFVLIIQPAVAVQTVDSLESRLLQDEGINKVKLYNELFKAHINSNPSKSLEYANHALYLAEDLKDAME